MVFHVFLACTAASTWNTFFSSSLSPSSLRALSFISLFLRFHFLTIFFLSQSHFYCLFFSPDYEHLCCDRRAKRGWEELPHIRGQGQKPGGPHAWRAAAKRTYPTSEVRGSGQECQTATAQEWPKGATRVRGQGARPRGDTQRPRSGAAMKGVNPRPRTGAAVSSFILPAPQLGRRTEAVKFPAFSQSYWESKYWCCLRAGSLKTYQYLVNLGHRSAKVSVSEWTDWTGLSNQVLAKTNIKEDWSNNVFFFFLFWNTTNLIAVAHLDWKKKL